MPLPRPDPAAPRFSTAPPVMYSQPKSPSPSTTALAPEFRTANRSPPRPARTAGRRWPEQREVADEHVGAGPVVVHGAGRPDCDEPPQADLPTPSLAVPVWTSHIPSLQNSPNDCPAAPWVRTRSHRCGRNRRPRSSTSAGRGRSRGSASAPRRRRGARPRSGAGCPARRRRCPPDSPRARAARTVADHRSSWSWWAPTRTGSATCGS